MTAVGVSNCESEAPWWLREIMQASRASGLLWLREKRTRKGKIQKGNRRRQRSRHIRMYILLGK